jgi:Queuosine biosynthesis protein QueC
MSEPHLILCGGATPTSRQRCWQTAPVVQLCISDELGDVHLRIEHLQKRLCAGVSGVITDLLEIAAFVYAADQAVSRGGVRVFEYGRRWRRHFRFEVPVRCPQVWRRPEVRAALEETLGCMSDDDYTFAFAPHPDPPTLDGYLFDDMAPEVSDFESIVLFSGGLDSLGGIVREVVLGHHKVALVSHRPANQVYHRQCELVRQLVNVVPEQRLQPLHVAVEINWGGSEDRDATQRSRSFLFASLAAVTSRLLGLWRIRFYENGILSLNLPINGQLVGGRATRTTHPQVLGGFQRLFTLLFGRDFAVENPFLWRTKTQILEEIRAAGAGRLCATAVSCIHTREQTPERTHCGRCSQCVDRRLAALAAGLSDLEDPPQRYASDVLTAPREGADLALIEGYVGAARRVAAMTDVGQFLHAFPEVARVLRHVNLPAARAIQEAFGLYQRHASAVLDALERAAGGELRGFVRLRHPPNCLLGLGIGNHPRPATPVEATLRPAADGVNGAPTTEALVLDPGVFEARYQGLACPLGNTLEYHLLDRLNRTPNRYVSHHELATDVWGDDQTRAGAIYRVVLKLRRRLDQSGLAVAIDGEEKGHYRVQVPAQEIPAGQP